MTHQPYTAPVGAPLTDGVVIPLSTMWHGPDQEPLICKPEIAARYGVSPKSIERWMRLEPPFPHHKPMANGAVRFRVSECDLWVDAMDATRRAADEPELSPGGRVARDLQPVIAAMRAAGARLSADPNPAVSTLGKGMNKWAARLEAVLLTVQAPGWGL